jgi:hypothetical protein
VVGAARLSDAIVAESITGGAGGVVNAGGSGVVQSVCVPQKAG